MKNVRGLINPEVSKSLKRPSNHFANQVLLGGRTGLLIAISIKTKQQQISQHAAQDLLFAIATLIKTSQCRDGENRMLDDFC